MVEEAELGVLAEVGAGIAGVRRNDRWSQVLVSADQGMGWQKGTSQRSR